MRPAGNQHSGPEWAPGFAKAAPKPYRRRNRTSLFLQTETVVTHDWNKAMDAVMSHEWIALAVLVWLLCIAGYTSPSLVWLRLDGPLAHCGACLVGSVGRSCDAGFIGQSYDPDVFRPVASPFDNLIVSVLLLSLGIYLPGACWHCAPGPA